MPHNEYKKSVDKKFLINLRPAMAGYIVDGRIADKEVIATIVDFIIKGYIDFIPKTTKWDKLRVGMLLFSNKARPSLSFENEFLKVLFADKIKLSIKGLVDVLKSKKLHDIIKGAVKDSDVNIEIIDEQVKFYLGKESKENKVEFYYKTAGMNNRYPKKVTTIEDWENLKKAFRFIAIGIAAIFGFFSLIFGVTSIFSGKSIFGIASIPIIVIIILFGASILGFMFYSIKKSNKFADQNVNYKDQITKDLRAKYHDLFEFIKKNPQLKEGRLFNEFLPYSIAFGFDTYWQKAFSTNGEKEEFTYRDNKDLSLERKYDKKREEE